MKDLISIWNSQLSTGEIIIKTIIDKIPQFKCFAATNHITGNHMFIMEVANNTIIPEFKNFKFKGVRIEIIYFENFRELTIYLLDNQLKDIFCLFIENIIEDITISVTENEALINTSNVILKWKKLFDKINFQGLSLENQKGLIGELLLFNTLMDENYAVDELLDSWIGPEYSDRDFIFKNIGAEVKFTSAKTPAIRISSDRQLDTQNLKSLYLILYVANEVKDKGFTLNSLVMQIRSKIEKNLNALKSFNEKLLLAGYLEEDIENYENQYAIKNQNVYIVNEEFPRIITSQLPVGIINTTYYIELSACNKHIVNINSFTDSIR